jgi:hypothetical protein
MEIIVHSSSENVKTRVHNVAMFYAALIRLQRFTSTVNIRQMRGLYKNIGAYGETNDISHMGGGVEVLLDANLPFSQLLSTLAHEMVHVKQILCGVLKTEIITTTDAAGNRALEQRLYWKGKDMTHLDYLDRPWEKQAFSKESIMVRHLNKFLAES